MESQFVNFVVNKWGSIAVSVFLQRIMSVLHKRIREDTPRVMEGPATM